MGPGLDVLANNAGVIQVGPLESMRAEDFRVAWETMFRAPLDLTLAALPLLSADSGATIVNIASLGGRIPAPHLLPYVAAKSALTGLSSGLRAELAGRGIRVTTVLPGLMRTGSHTAARFSGRADREYAWFAPAACAPLLAMDAGRAARKIVRAAERGRPELILTPAAKAAIRFHGLAPATSTRLLTLIARLLPSAGPDPEHSVPGVRAARRHRGGLLARLTASGDRAGDRNNEPVARAG